MSAKQDKRTHYYVGPVSPDERARMSDDDVRAMKAVFEVVYNEAQRILALGDEGNAQGYPEELRSLIEHDLRQRADVGKAVLLQALGVRNEDVLTEINAEIVNGIPDIFSVVER